jgi:histidine triad (HIT) family protein
VVGDPALFIRGTAVSGDCLFCKIVSGEIPADTVFQNERVLAFRDISPQAPTHVLVIPREHVTSVESLEDEGLAGELLLVARDVARAEGLSEAGYRLVTNIGSDGGQAVFHLHIHVLGGRSMGWPPG